MARVGIIGIGHGTFGRRSDATVQELAYEAFREAVQDAGIERKDLDASVIGAVPEYHKQRSLPGVVQEYLGLTPTPTWLCEVACASGSVRRSVPRNRIRPPSMAATRSGKRRRTERLVTDFPEPDSPTSPSTSPGFTSKDTSSTAVIRPSSVSNCRVRFSTLSSARMEFQIAGSGGL